MIIFLWVLCGWWNISGACTFDNDSRPVMRIVHKHAKSQKFYTNKFGAKKNLPKKLSKYDKI